MKLSRSMKWTCCALGAIVLGVLTAPEFGVAQERAGGPPPVPMTNASHTRMQPEEANPNGNTPIFGLQNQEGFYVYRNRFGPHQTSKPHFHDKDRWVTVIKGTWYTGEGDVFKPETMVPIKAGGFMYHKANMHHYDGSMDDNEVIVQLSGYGPLKSVQTEVDAQGNPVGAGRGRGGDAGAAPGRGPGTTPAGR